ncbi:MAG: uroporphyrinogen decarboxylase [Planctomycetes bacterium]|nr:uroporphyrinogen decarboxylase [Planctomycetota bacterium]
MPSPLAPKLDAAPTIAPVNDLLLRAARRERTERTPVWLMRQAGRFDPKYLAIRDRCGLELEDLFRDPELACQITMLPMRFGVDAAILFQDILTPLAPLGARFVYRPGPVLEAPIRSRCDIDRLRAIDPRDKLSFVSMSIKLVLSKLNGALPLIGFAGAPLTLATFMIEGRSPGAKADHTRQLMKQEPALCHTLLELLANVTADYLTMQIEAGVHVVQLFESVADLFSREEYEQFAHPYQEAVLRRLGRSCPTILFVKEQPYLDLMAQTGADVLSVGGCVDLCEARAEYGDRVAFQGNVDNRVLHRGSLDEIDEAVEQCLRSGDRTGHILNLNHGVLKGTPIENVRRFIDAARAFTYDRELVDGVGPCAK